MRFLICFILIFSACQTDKNSQKIIGQEKMKLIVWDMLRADEYVMNSLQADTTKTLKQHLTDNYARVFSVHNIDSKVFYESYRYYQSHPLLHKELMDSVYAYGTRERSKLDPKMIKDPKPGFE